MTSVTQTIPNYVAGISQQPDQFKNPGKVSDAVNVVPDITQGLVKRPGSKLITTLSPSSSGTWFHYSRDETEQYIGQIQQGSGSYDPVVKIWNCKTGEDFSSYIYYGTDWISGSSYTKGDHISYDINPTDSNPGRWTYKAKTTHSGVTTNPNLDTTNWERVISHDIFSYLRHSATEDLQFLTVNDYTYICNRNKAVTLTDNKTSGKPHPYYAFIDLKKTVNARQYSVNLYNSSDTISGLRTVTRLKHIGGPQARNIGLQQGGTGYLVYDAGNAATNYSVTMTGSNADSTEVNPGGRQGNARNTGSSTGPITTLVTNGRGDDLRPTSTITISAPPSGTTATGHIYEWEPSHTAYPSGQTNAGRWQGTCDDISTEVHHSSEDFIQVYEVTPGSGSTPRTYEELVRAADGTFNNSSSPQAINKRKNLLWRMTISGQSGVAAGRDGTAANDRVCSYQHDIDLLHGGEGWKEGDIIVYNQKGNAEARHYFLEVEKVESSTLKCKLDESDPSNPEGWIRPEPTPFDADTAVTANSILAGLKTEIDNIGGSYSGDEYEDSPNNGVKITATIIGNGLYLNSNKSFNIESSEYDLMNIMTDEVNDVGKLPVQCKHGYIVKIANSEAEEDDYFMKFEGDNGLDGTGSWTECPKPDIYDTIDTATFPLQLVRKITDAGQVYFEIGQTSLGKRDVGEDTTNPIPTFVSLRTAYGDDSDEDRTINKVLFWRNRIVLLSGTNVICSQPGDGNITNPNFWAKTALTVSSTDAIDMSCSSTDPATLFDGIEVPSGLLLFSANHQFLLTHDSEILNPDTAKIETLGTFNYNTAVPPISLGVTVGFLDNAGKVSRFFEMMNIQRSQSPDVLDQSAPIPTLLPKNINLLTSSKENTFVLAAVEGENTIYGYKYFDSGQKRLQSAWFKWTLRNAIKYHAIINDSYYVVDSGNSLLRFDLKTDDTTGVIGKYPIHLDSYKTIAASEFTYVDIIENGKRTNKTIFGSQPGFSTIGTLVAYDTTSSTSTLENYGRYAVANWNIATGQWELPGDWTQNSVYLGYVFDMEVKIPTIYVAKTSGESIKNDVNASLIVHRAKLALGNTGRYTTVLTRTGRETYEELIEPTIQDAYEFGSVPIDEDRIHTVPIYDRNTNASLTLKSSHPAPATLLSMSWEGDYTDKYYKRA